MDSRKSQTFAASPAEPGELPIGLAYWLWGSASKLHPNILWPEKVLPQRALLQKLGVEVGGRDASPRSGFTQAGVVSR
jgi:hypothetical protein